MVGGGDFVKIMGLALGGKEMGGVFWWNDFREGIVCDTFLLI